MISAPTFLVAEIVFFDALIFFEVSQVDVDLVDILRDQLRIGLIILVNIFHLKKYGKLNYQKVASFKMIYYFLHNQVL